MNAMLQLPVVAIDNACTQTYAVRPALLVSTFRYLLSNDTRVSLLSCAVAQMVAFRSTSLK